MSDNATKYGVLIQQYLQSILDISAICSQVFSVFCFSSFIAVNKFLKKLFGRVSSQVKQLGTGHTTPGEILKRRRLYFYDKAYRPR